MHDKYTEGRAEGLIEGEARGEVRGDKTATYRIAKNQLKRGVAIEIIMEDTGLTSAEVESIKNEIAE